MITSVNLSNLRNAEYIQFLKDFLKLVQQNDPTALLVAMQYAQLFAVLQSLQNLFKTPTGSGISDELVALDERRDNAINGISQMIAALSYSTDIIIRGHAKTLADHLSIFGAGIARESYQTETTIITNVIDDWNNKPALAAALAALNLGGWKTELETANSLFEQQYLARAVEAGSATADTIKAKRLEANALYYKLRDRLNSYFDINEGADPWGKTVADCNGLIGFYNDTLSRRGSSGSEATTPATTAPTA